MRMQTMKAMNTGYAGLLFLSAFLLFAFGPLPTASAHGPSEPGGHEAHVAPDHGAAMQAQHERMAKLRVAAQTVFEGVIRSDGRMALEGADRLQGALEGHEKDVPHKNRKLEKEFHALYAELGKRTETMKTWLRAKNFSGAAASYGQVLSVCASCHGKFRD